MSKAKSIVAAMVVVAIAVSAQAAGPTPKTLVKRYYALSDVCQGDSPTKASTRKACADRERVSAELEAKGYCFGEGAEAAYLERWKPCRRRAPPPAAPAPAYDPQKAQGADQDQQWRETIGGMALDVERCISLTVPQQMRSHAQLGWPVTLEASLSDPNVQRCYSGFREAAAEHHVMALDQSNRLIRDWITEAYKGELAKGAP